MVEILGVLAIIGVLSVGGIAGYRSAANSIKLNQVRNIIDYIMLSYFTEIQKPVGKSIYDSTDAETRINSFCEFYAGSGFCGTIDDCPAKKFVSSKAHGGQCYLTTHVSIQQKLCCTTM